MIQSRRKFLETIAIAGVTIPFTSLASTSFTSGENHKLDLRLFSKPLDKYDFDFMCECIKASGIGGLDLTVRRGGRIEPENVESELPAMVKKARFHDLALDMIVTDITSASDPYTERVLRTASGNGIRYYRLGWFDYTEDEDIMNTLMKYKERLGPINELNVRYGLHGGYQNHAGTKVGGPVWDLLILFDGLPVVSTGSQFDVRHAMVEGTDTWIVGMRLIAGHIRTLAIKDFMWENINGKPQPVTVPLGEGMVDWDRFFKTVKRYGITGPMTLHIEYDLLNKEEEQLPLDKQKEIIIKKLRKDAIFLMNYLEKYQL